MTQPAPLVTPQLPVAYYPGPALLTPMKFHAERDESSGSDGDSDSDSDSDSCESGPGLGLGSRKVLLAVALAVAIVLAIVILYYLFAPRGGAQSALARALARCGWSVYLLQGCGACEKQMQLLPGFDRSILCGGSANAVQKPGLAPIAGYTGKPSVPGLSCSGIPAYPYWHNDRTGESRVGFQDYAALGRMALGCASQW
jgi:hypothetical protein